MFPAILIFSKGVSQSITPDIVNSSGGTKTYGYYCFDWSVGEASAIETMSTGNIILTNGVLQPENKLVTNFNLSCEIDEVVVYPNPTNGRIEVDFLFTQTGRITLNFFDESGRLLSRQQFDYFGNGQIVKTDLSRFPSSIYFLEILLEPTGSSVPKKCIYKIVKIN